MSLDVEDSFNAVPRDDIEQHLANLDFIVFLHYFVEYFKLDALVVRIVEVSRSL